MKTIGVLGLQGGVSLHVDHLVALGANVVIVKRSADFDKIDALVIPGGESSVMLKLIDILGIKQAMEGFVRHKPVYGTCAGAILMAQKVFGPEQFSFGAIDVDIVRNGYGSQNDSFGEVVDGYEVCFIRAPIITRVGSGVDVVAEYQSKPVWVKSKNVMLTTFHPECNKAHKPSPMHKFFVDSFL